VPEVNFPAHADAALIAYPFLGKAGSVVSELNPAWGKHDHCMQEGDQTWNFVDTLFGELARLFPDEYIHIGGDEVLDSIDSTCVHIIIFRLTRLFSQADACGPGAAFMKHIASIAANHSRKVSTRGSTLLAHITTPFCRDVDCADTWTSCAIGDSLG
jgi:hexosaminidase